MTDFHAHILPGADHGCLDIKTSLFQLASAEAAGITAVVATTHFYPDKMTEDEFPVTRDAAYAKLRSEYHGSIRIIPAAEVFLCPGLEHYPHLSSISVGGSNIMLIEMPPPAWTRRQIDTLYALRELDYKIILAHIERYPRRDIEPLLRDGFKAQMNAGYICSIKGRADARKLIRDGKLFAVGTDIHGADTRSYKDYVKAQSILGDDAMTLQSRMSDMIDFIPAVI